MGCDVSWKTRLELFSLDWVTRLVGDKRPYDERNELRESIHILRNLEKARTWVAGFRGLVWGDEKNMQIGIGMGRIGFTVRWDRMEKTEDRVQDFKNYIRDVKVRMTMDKRLKDWDGSRHGDKKRIEMVGEWDGKLST